MRKPSRPFAAILTLALVSAPSGAIMAQGAADEPVPQGADLLPGAELTTEQVEPGVFRVVSDGVRELAYPIEPEVVYGWHGPGDAYRYSAFEASGIVAGDESVWLRRPAGIIRLGEEEPVWVPQVGKDVPDFAATPDGTLYRPNAQMILEGDAWEEVKLGVRKHGVREVDRVSFAPDGSLWVLGDNGKKGTKARPRLARRDEDGWDRIAAPPLPPQWLKKQRERAREGRTRQQFPTIRDWAITPDGTLYVNRHGRYIQRFDGTSWETLEPTWNDVGLHAGPDGTVWVRSRPGSGEWHERQVTRIDTEAGAPADTEHHPLFRDQSAAGIDGTFWYAAHGDPMTTGGCDGIARTDGTTTTTFLDGNCIYDLAIGPNGAVWLQAGSWDGNYFVPDEVGPLETYVITTTARPPAG